jgi:hypothetical protein
MPVAHVETNKTPTSAARRGTEYVFRAIVPLHLYRSMNQIRIQKKRAGRHPGRFGGTEVPPFRKMADAASNSNLSENNNVAA